MHKNCPVITAVSGFVVLIFGAVGSWYIFPKIIDMAIHSNIDLVEGTQGYDFWRVQPFPLKFKIWFFNVTNAADVQFGAKPIVKEIGPYVFDEYRERIQISVNDKQDTLKYILKKTYFFNKTDSGCHDIDDYVTILNVALVGTALQVELILPTAVSMVSDAIPYLYPGVKSVFLTAPVRNILFEGIRIHCKDEEVEFICGAMRSLLPKTVTVAENDKDFIFSMFGHLNGTDDGPWEMERGLKNTSRGEVYSWENHVNLTMWSGKYCNQINGSDSTVFAPIKGKDRPERLYSFAQDFCRSLYVNFETESSEFGLPVLRYTTKEESLARIPENDCFCPKRQDDDGNTYLDCPPPGLADITACMKAPVLISYPHFYLADKKLFDYVSGLKPDKDLHQNYVNLEPRTATPLSGRKRIQLNMHVKPLDGFQLLENVTEGIFPILWIEEGVTLPDDVANFIVSNLSKTVYLNAFKWVLIVIGILLIVTAFFMVMQKEKLLCFSNSTTVNITNPKSASMNGDNEINLGRVNPGFEGDNNKTAVAGEQRRNWNPNVWHT